MFLCCCTTFQISAEISNFQISDENVLENGIFPVKENRINKAGLFIDEVILKRFLVHRNSFILDTTLRSEKKFVCLVFI